MSAVRPAGGASGGAVAAGGATSAGGAPSDGAAPPAGAANPGGASAPPGEPSSPGRAATGAAASTGEAAVAGAGEAARGSPGRRRRRRPRRDLADALRQGGQRPVELVQARPQARRTDGQLLRAGPTLLHGLRARALGVLAGCALDLAGARLRGGDDRLHPAAGLAGDC